MSPRVRPRSPKVVAKGPSGALAKRSTSARGSRSAPALRVPTGLYSHLGTIPVTLKEMERNLGEFRYADRAVTIDPGQTEEARMQTLGHELMHTILWDSGLHYLLPSKMEEALCDAFGSWLVGAVRAGSVKLCSPKS